MQLWRGSCFLWHLVGECSPGNRQQIWAWRKVKIMHHNQATFNWPDIVLSPKNLSDFLNFFLKIAFKHQIQSNLKSTCLALTFVVLFSLCTVLTYTYTVLTDLYRRLSWVYNWTGLHCANSSFIVVLFTVQLEPPGLDTHLSTQRYCTLWSVCVWGIRLEDMI